MATVYGPVLSWRFGRSLGIDVVTPPKKCTFNCIYCQLGRTMVHVTGLEGLHQPLVRIQDVVADLEAVVKRLDLNTVDIVTFSGTGEPTLNPELGNIAMEVKDRVNGLPLAILTNSSLLHLNMVRKNLCAFDLIVAKLDTGDDETLRLINRPAEKRLGVSTIIDSIKKLKREFHGVLALETMLLSSRDRSITNVEGTPQRQLLDAILHVEPDIVQLETPYRPTAESKVLQPTRDKIKLISQKLSTALGEDRLWVYGQWDRREKHVSWLTHKSLEEDVLKLLKRRPCRMVDIAASFGIGRSNVQSILRNLVKKNLIATKISEGEKYYSYHR